MDTNKERKFYYIGESTPVNVEELDKGTAYLLREKGDAEAKSYVMVEGFKEPQEMHWESYTDLAESKQGNTLWALYTERFDNDQWNRIGITCPFENHLFKCFDILRFVDPVDNEPVGTMPAEFDTDEEVTSKMNTFILIKDKPGCEEYLVPIEHYGKWFQHIFIDKAAVQLRIARNMYNEQFEGGLKKPFFMVSDKD
jgi:hypothetical protein